MVASLFAVLLGLLQGASAPAEEAPETLFLRARELVVRPGRTLENGAVLVRSGQILAVGVGLAPPEGARVIEGDVICAGFVDPWSALGLDSTSARDAGTSASTRTVDGFDPYGATHLREDALRAGVTAVRLQAGARSVMGGLGAVVRTDPTDLDGAVLLEDACVGATVGVSRGGSEVDVFTRVEEVDRLVSMLERGNAHLEATARYERELAEWRKEIAEKEEELEKDFKKAKKDRDKDVEEAEEKGKEFKEKKYKEDRQPKPPKADPNDVAIARVVRGELPLVCEIHRAEELRELLEATESMTSLRLVIAGGTEAFHHAEQLAERDIPVIVWPSPQHSSGLDEYEEHRLSLAAELAAKGVEVLLGSGGLATASSRDLPLLASLAVGHGLNREAALDAITLAVAEAFDLADELGSIERGKQADLVVLDGDPFDSGTRVQYVISRGRVVVQP